MLASWGADPFPLWGVIDWDAEGGSSCQAKNPLLPGTADLSMGPCLSNLQGFPKWMPSCLHTIHPSWVPVCRTFRVSIGRCRAAPLCPGDPRRQAKENDGA